MVERSARRIFEIKIMIIWAPHWYEEIFCKKINQDLTCLLAPSVLCWPARAESHGQPWDFIVLTQVWMWPLLWMQKVPRIKLLLRTLAHFYPSSYPGRGVSRNVRRLPPESALFNNLQKNNSWGWGCISAKNTGRTNRNIFCLLRVIISHSPHVPLCVNSVLKKNSFLHIISIGQFVVYLHCFWEWVLQLWLDYLAGENNVFRMFTDPSVGPQFRFVAFFDAAFVSGASFWANMEYDI